MKTNVREDWKLILTAITAIIIALFYEIVIYNISLKNPGLGRLLFWAVSVILCAGVVLVLVIAKEKKKGA